MTLEALKEELVSSMAELNEDQVLASIRKLVDAGCTYSSILVCLNTGVFDVGKRFENGEYFIGDLIVSGMIYQSALTVLQPIHTGNQSQPLGRVVIGVVQGDIHDVGKDIVVGLLRAEHFEVIDLGIDVKPERFAHAVQTYRPDVLLLSGVLNIARSAMRETMDLLRKEGLRDTVPVLIGGLCASEYQMHVVGADGWAYDTTETINFCKRIVGNKNGKNA